MKGLGKEEWRERKKEEKKPPKKPQFTQEDDLSEGHGVSKNRKEGGEINWLIILTCTCMYV